MYWLEVSNVFFFWNIPIKKINKNEQKYTNFGTLESNKQVSKILMKGKQFEKFNWTKPVTTLFGTGFKVGL